MNLHKKIQLGGSQLRLSEPSVQLNPAQETGEFFFFQKFKKRPLCCWYFIDGSLLMEDAMYLQSGLLDKPLNLMG